MGRIVDIFKTHGSDYIQRYGPRLLPSHRRTIADICHCRTPLKGGHVYHCTVCNHYRYSYHCCGNRHCPQCRSANSAQWVDQRLKELLPVPYFHLVFTLPSTYRALMSQNQQTGYRVLFKAAAKALMDICADERYVGARIGIVAVLHTWSRAMVYHPHIHMLVPGVGLAQDGTTAYFCRHRYLVPVKALSKRFRANFIAMITAALPAESIPGCGPLKPWVVYCKHLDLGPQKAIAYLGRYLNRVAVSDTRVSELAGGDILVKGATARKRGCVRLTPSEFLRRYLQHVLPKGFNRVRRYGLLAPCHRQKFQSLRSRLLLSAHNRMVIWAALAASRTFTPKKGHWQRCPVCGRGLMMRVAHLAPQPRTRSPPKMTSFCN
jgi:hypothetical protein